MGKGPTITEFKCNEQRLIRNNKLPLSGSWSINDYREYDIHHKLIKSKGDGHCFLHSLSTCLDIEGQSLTMPIIFEKVKNEIKQNAFRYVEYGVTLSELIKL